MQKQDQKQTGKILMIVLMCTLTISAMSAFMFNIVLPEISAEFSLTISQVSWLASAYTLIYAIGTVTYGKLADRFKLKNLLTFGLLLFAIGSFIGLISQTFALALVGRCIQAVGAAVIPATAMIIPVRYFPPERRGRALGMSAVGLALGGVLGPIVSSLIVSMADWRWLFSVPLLILLTLPFYRSYLRNEEKQSIKFDWIGGGLLAATVTLLLLGITHETWLMVLGGLLGLILFIVRICVVTEPFIQPRLFKNKKYAFGLLITFLISGIAHSLHFLSPLLLAEVHQLSPSWIGFVMVPAATAAAIFGRMGGKLADRKGDTTLFFLAASLLFTCFVLLSTFIGSSPLLIAAFLIFGNVGMSFVMIAMSNSVSRTLSKSQVGVGMGMFSMLNFIAGSAAVTLYGKVVDIGASNTWNWANLYTEGFIYSNIFFVLAVLLVAILLLYRFQFGKGKENSIQSLQNSTD